MKANQQTLERQEVLDAFRRWGYLQAKVDPFGKMQPQRMLELELYGKEAELARRYHCGSIAGEFK